MVFLSLAPREGAIELVAPVVAVNLQLCREVQCCKRVLWEREHQVCAT